LRIEMLKLGDDPGYSERSHNHHRTGAAFAELGDAEICLQRALTRSTKLATKSPALMSAPAMPAPRVRGPMCAPIGDVFGIVGWLPRSSASAAEKDRCRGKRYKRAQTLFQSPAM
jgi:hypothetical protein